MRISKSNRKGKMSFKQGIKQLRNEGKLIQLNYVVKEDMKFWFSLDKHMSEREFLLKVRDQRGYIIRSDNIPIGTLRYSLFWDNTPFMNFIYLIDEYQGKEFGAKAMQLWETEMKESGYQAVMNQHR